MAAAHLSKALKLFDQLDRRHNRATQFDALLTFAFCSLANQTHFPSTPQHAAIEKQYMDEVKRWPVENVREIFPKIMAEVMIHAKSTDFLGDMAGELGLLNSHLGQFFTPWHLCKLMAGINTPPDMDRIIKDKGYFSLQEPAVGGGAMVLAMGEVLREKGYDPARHMYVHATDLSLHCYRMSYIQLSAAGIAGIVVHGNSLTDEVFDTQFTPPMGTFLKYNRPPWEATPKPAVRKRKRRSTDDIKTGPQTVRRRKRQGPAT